MTLSENVIATENSTIKIKDAINELLCVDLEYYFHNLKIIKQYNDTGHNFLV